MALPTSSGGGNPVVLTAPGSLPIIFWYSISSAVMPDLAAPATVGAVAESCQAPRKTRNMSSETMAARKLRCVVFMCLSPSC